MPDEALRVVMTGERKDQAELIAPSYADAGWDGRLVRLFKKT